MNYGIPVRRQLQRPMALAAAIVMPAILLAGTAHLAQGQALAERDAAAARHDRSESRWRQLQSRQPDIRDQAALFLRLQADGIVGGAKPLEWVELLHDVRQDLRLPGMKYELLPTAATDSGFTFHSTTMRLQLQILHEEDLLNFLEHLQQKAKALVLVRSCRLARLPPVAAAGERPPAHLRADCEIDWATAYGKEEKRS